MNISAVKATPIKPQSFKGIEQNYKQLHSFSNELQANSVESDDIKKPLAIAASLAALVTMSYVNGKASAKAGSAIFELIQDSINKIKSKGQEVVNEVKDDAKQAVKKSNLGEVVETGLKKAAAFVSENTAKLRTSAEDAVKLTKSQVVKNKIADAIDFVLDLAKSIYKKIAYSNIPADVVGAQRAEDAFENVAGAVSVATVVPEILSRDADGDGVKDILQKSQNAYTRSEEKFGKLSKDINAVGEIVQILT